HWRYKGVQQGESSSEQWLARLRELLENTDTHTVQRRFDSTLSSGEIFLFTPNGDLRRMSEGATVLDFAFSIHTNLGATCIGAKVNGRNVPIKHVLSNGDIVEVLTSKTQKPKPDWLNIATSTRAKNKIRTCLREEQAKVANLGREELERKLKNWKLPVTFDEAVTFLSKYYKQKAITFMYMMIANEKLDMADIKDVLTRYTKGEFDEEHKTTTVAAPKALKSAESGGDVLTIDDSIRNLDYKFAKCCNPVMGDEIFGFVTINAGITIHRVDCPNGMHMQERHPYRVIPARWRTNAASRGFRATIRISVDDVTGIVNKITDIITQEMKLNIRLVNMRPDRKENKLIGTIDLEVPHTGALDAVVYKLLSVKGVDKAYRVK
ncbi:MAG: bifunctional (p)ppGpp synthetase/guanosine-3',5'-bis(diphosphate) 3'-pyrophosphohydrolase, partial [Rikenellaceae bacterium]|nr:bifunctional (p)ppGpp synthetase/guanosine-3',5'-bis(diphosphate) 3'-pyrophosphohydrolase [Rikenellaceae bacterium]